jgi:iron complex outermembrane receptor protein
VLAPFHAFLGGDLDTESFSFFGNATWPLIEEKLNLRVGARYTNDTKKIDEYNIVTVAAFPTLARTATDQTSWGEDTYEAIVEYFPFEKTMLYAKASTGFKAGGYNAGALTPAFDPETAMSYEVGLKTRFFDGRVDLGIAAFHTDYDDLQTAQVGTLTVIVSNAAEAKMQGIELEGSVLFTDGFRLSGTFAYLDATFEEYMNRDTANPAAGIQDLSGLNLPNAPEVTFSITPEYSFSIGGVGTFKLFGVYSYSSRDYLEQFNHNHFSQPSVDLFDAGASFETVNGKILVSAYGKNLTDEEVLNSLFVSSGITLAVGSGDVSPPRTYGVRVQYNF